MKKVLAMGLVFVFTLAIIGCDLGENNTKLPGTSTDLEERILLGQDDLSCQGSGNYIVIDNQCLLMQDILSTEITVSGNQSKVHYMNNIELMDELVADLSGSKGLAVVSRDVYDTQEALSQEEEQLSALSLSSTADEMTENLIVKLTDDGFFEEVSFKDSSGFEVNIKSNPLALEVFGAFTVVIFDVDLGYTHNRNFNQRIWDSLHSGGVYVIHNETGKVFSTMMAEFDEETETWVQDNSYYVHTTANVNEPVMREVMVYKYDDNDQPIYDADGHHLYEVEQVPVLDENGEPVIFETGPILTEFEQIPLFKHYQVLVYDDNGEVVYDDNGEPVYEEQEEPLLDDNGNQVYFEHEVPVLDSDGNPQYVENFEVEVFIHEVTTYTETFSYAHMTHGPLYDIAHRFVDRIISEYYNWNYYRVHNYQISHWDVGVDGSDLYYMANKDVDDSYERVVMRVSFDSLTDEIVLEEYINASRAGFEECNLYIDPVTSNIICLTWDSNIRIYSKDTGLVTVPDTDQFEPIIFPNGELYFYTWQDDFIEELGYQTRLLYTIDAEGGVESRHIELGERDSVCQQDQCNTGFNVKIFNEDGEQITHYNHHLPFVYTRGDKIIEEGNMTVRSIEEFDSTREACESDTGCYADTILNIFNEGTFIGRFSGAYDIYPGDSIPGFEESYDISDNATITYRQKWSDIDKVCENDEIGCLNDIQLYDESINLWLHIREVISVGETFIDRFEVKEQNNALYDYTKELKGFVCEYDTCHEHVDFIIYDLEGNKIVSTNATMDIAKGEVVPLYIEYHMTEATHIVESDTVCTTSTGCWRHYPTLDGTWIGISYEQGETMYETIEFAESDRNSVTEETRTSEICNNIDGCPGHVITYLILDDNDEILYEFSSSHWIDYGYRLPYSVTLTLDDVNTYNYKESLNEDEVCESEVCYQYVSIRRIQGDKNSYVASGTIKYTQGEKIINTITLNDGITPFDVRYKRVCDRENGCVFHTRDFTIIDSDNNILPYNDSHNNTYPVYFKHGAVIPNESSDLIVTFELTDIEYRKERLNAYNIFDRIHNIAILEDNYYFIPRSIWNQGQDNFMLEYNPETLQYRAFYTNLPSMHEIAALGDGYVGINDDKTAIYYVELNLEASTDYYHYFDVIDLTEGKQINAVNSLSVDYDGSIYFNAVDNFIQDISGIIASDGTVMIDTTYTEREVIRLRPIN